MHAVLRMRESPGGRSIARPTGGRDGGAGEVAMNQESGEGQQSSGSGLPDFSASSSTRSSQSLPDLASREGPVTLGEPSERTLRRNRTTMLAVIGTAVVVMAVVALVLSQTVFRSVLDPAGPTAYQTGQRTAQGQSEYVPDPED